MDRVSYDISSLKPYVGCSLQTLKGQQWHVLNQLIMLRDSHCMGPGAFVDTALIGLPAMSCAYGKKIKGGVL